MTQIETLKTLLEREQSERDMVRVAWETAQRQAQQAREQASQLTQYRSDYRAKWSQRFTQSHTIEILRHYQSYVAR